MAKKTKQFLNSYKKEDPKIVEENVVAENTGLNQYNVKIIIHGINESINIQVDGHDTIQDIKSAILENQATCFRTSICIRNEKSEKLDECAEIKSICHNPDNSLTITATDEPYTFQSVIFHIKTFYTILCSDVYNLAFQGRAQLSLSLCRHIGQLAIPDTFTKEKRSKQKISLNPPSYILSTEEVPLNPFFANFNFNEKTKCIKSLRLSLYNPPYNNRKLIGDLLYLEIVSLEGVFYGITCRVDGFYVNKSTVNNFDPCSLSDEIFSYTLDALLSKVSALFKNAINKIQANTLERYPLEVTQTPNQVCTWLGMNMEYNEDIFRTIESVSSSSFFEESSSSGQMRDWNEEYQSIKLLPQNDLNEQILRERYLHKFDIDLTLASRKGAMAVIDGQITSINDMDEDKLKMYVWNNLFICIACDSRDHFKGMGGDVAGHVSSGLDMDGIRIFNDFDIPNLHSLGTRVVDYCGYRLVIQTILPGIFHRDPLQTIDYGSIDHGKTIFTHSKFETMLKGLTTPLGLVSQIVLNENNEEVKLVSSLEFKGIIGTDGRCYLLDLYRLLPPDPTFVSEDLLTIEEEIVDLKNNFTASRNIAKEKGFIIPQNYTHKLSSYRIEYLNYINLSNEIKPMFDSYYQKCYLDNNEKLTNGGEIPIDLGEIPIDNDEKSNIKYISDCFDITVKRPESESNKVKESRNCLRVLASFMLESYIPKLIKDLLDINYFRIIDGQALTDYLHERGVNIRYLGYIENFAKDHKQLKHITNIIIMEMICRVAKRILRYCLKKTDKKETAAMIAHFLNCFLGSNPTPKIFFSHPQKQNKKIKLSNTSHVYLFYWKNLTPAFFWNVLLNDVSNSFGFKTAIHSIEELCSDYGINRLALLRSICIKSGIQLLSINNYDFKSKKGAVFTPSDVLNIFPVVKPSKILSRSKLGRELINLKNMMFKPTMEIVTNVHDQLQHLMLYFEQVTSNISLELAECYSLLSSIYSFAKDVKQAESCRLKATIMFERLLGIDHYQTITSYYQLALNTADSNNYHSSVLLMYRSIYLIQLSYGLSHPFIFEIELKLAYYFHTIQDDENSRIYTDRIKRWIDNSSTLSYHHLTQAHQLMAYIYALSHQYNLAMSEEKKISTIYDNINLSENDPKVKECTQRYTIYLEHELSERRKNIKA